MHHQQLVLRGCFVRVGELDQVNDGEISRRLCTGLWASSTPLPESTAIGILRGCPLEFERDMSRHDRALLDGIST